MNADRVVFLARLSLSTSPQEGAHRWSFGWFFMWIVNCGSDTTLYYTSGPGHRVAAQVIVFTKVLGYSGGADGSPEKQRCQ